MGGFRLGGACLVLALAGCRSASFECASDDACKADGVQGWCEPLGFCSFPDDTCPSGRRFGDQSENDLAGMCVQPTEPGPVGGGSSGNTTTSASGSESTGADSDSAGASSDGGDVSSDGGDDSTGAPPVTVNYVFLTSQPVPLDQGVEAVDALCNELAAESGLPGTYVAWMSTSTQGAVERLGDARGWLRPDGRPFADTVQDLLTGDTTYPPNVDESGATLRGLRVATSTDDEGLAYDRTCEDWSSNTAEADLWYGNSGFGGYRWSSYSITNCDQPLHAYCFGTEHQEPVVATPMEGRLAFTSAGIIRGDAGIEAMDALCNTESLAAGYGPAKAFVATGGAAAIDRFETRGLPWVNARGVPLAPTAGAFALAVHLDAPANFTATGERIADEFWTGTSGIAEVPNDRNCDDWTNPDESGLRELNDSTDSWLDTYSTSCDSEFHLLCFEE
ncbi:MAG: hypothetical protein AAGA54_31695 [Myxococcota bacterium]